MKRRVFLKLLGGGAALAAMPLPLASLTGLASCGDNAMEAAPRFFTAHEWETIDAATAIILPAAARGVSASDALAVRYIDRLLSAFDDPSGGAPEIFAGGPASGRRPYPDAHGVQSHDYPPDDMASFLPLPRVREIAWRMRIFGSAATTGGTFNDGVLGPTVGWRDLYRSAVMALDAQAAAVSPGAQFVDLGPADQAQALAAVSGAVPQFGRALIEHTLEGTFAVPEYGGNDRLAGWTLARYDGDSYPLGYSTYDPSIDAYVDHANEPTSTATPNTAPETFDDDIVAALTVAAVGSGGMRFF